LKSEIGGSLADLGMSGGFLEGHLEKGLDLGILGDRKFDVMVGQGGYYIGESYGRQDSEGVRSGFGVEVKDSEVKFGIWRNGSLMKGVKMFSDGSELKGNFSQDIDQRKLIVENIEELKKSKESEIDPGRNSFDDDKFKLLKQIEHFKEVLSEQNLKSFRTAEILRFVNFIEKELHLDGKSISYHFLLNSVFS
jgi:hypothetical protein